MNTSLTEKINRNRIDVTDINMPELDVYGRMSDAQLIHACEPELGLFVVESVNVTLRAMKQGYEPLSLLVERKRLDEILAREAAGGESRADAHSAAYDWTGTLDVDGYRIGIGESNPAGCDDRALTGNEPSADITIPNSGTLADVIRLAGEVPIYTADISQLKLITGVKLTGGLVCVMKRRPMPSVEEVCRGKHRIVILEKVMNPINVGAIFRSAAALNMEAVLLTAGCADPLYRRAGRVSMGTVFQIPWTYVELPEAMKNHRSQVRDSAENPGRYLYQVQRLGFRTAALALTENSVPIDNATLCNEDKLALVMGSEGDGLFPETIEDSDYTAMIPMAPGIDSLNVAAAAAVAFWQVTRGI